jgi:uncharacterized protein (DUF697 family)
VPSDSTSWPMDAMRAISQSVQSMLAMADDVAANAGNGVMSSLQPVVEPTVATMGQVVAPIGRLPFIQQATIIPGVKWLLAAIGQVNAQAVRQQVDDLRQRYPLDTQRQLAHRVITEATTRAAAIGLATNIIPPVALLLTLVDIGAVAALQADMIYRIAAIYGYSPDDDSRRGEVLGLWLLSSGGASVVKGGFSTVEMIPVVGAMTGVATDAGLLSGIGYLACRYYETKRDLPTEIPIQAE